MKYHQQPWVLREKTASAYKDFHQELFMHFEWATKKRFGAPGAPPGLRRNVRDLFDHISMSEESTEVAFY
jgi:hypothetical protein